MLQGPVEQQPPQSSQFMQGQQPGYQQPQPTQGQQPMNQPPMFQQPQPQPKKSHKRRWIIIGVVAVVLIAIIVTATNGNKNPTNNTSTGTPATTPISSTNQPQSQGQKSPAMGQAVQSGNWMVTLNSVTSSNGDGQFNIPKSGDVYLVANVTLKNTGSSTTTVSSLVMFALKDSTGQTYNEVITIGGTPDGSVAANGLLRGNINYEVPASVHAFTLQFTPDLTTNDLVEWNVHL